MLLGHYELICFFLPNSGFQVHYQYILCYQQVYQVFSIDESSVSAEEKIQNNVAEPSCHIIANMSFFAFSKYGGEPLEAFGNLYPSLW